MKQITLILMCLFLSILLCQYANAQAPANDNCIGATILTCGSSVTGNTTIATPTAGSGNAKDVWYTYVGTGQPVTFSTCNSTTNFDSYMELYSGACGALTLLTSNDNGCGSTPNNRSAIRDFCGISGTTYTLRIFGALSNLSGVFTLDVSCSNIIISPATLLNGTVGTGYAQTLTSGISGTPTWSLSAGTLPPGLTLYPTSGGIGDTPTVDGTFNFTVSVTNGACSASRNYTIVIAPACPTITFGTATATNGTVGTAYSLNAGATTTSGTLVYSVTPALPAGLSISATTGLISGTPTVVTTSATYTVRAQTSATCFVTNPYTFGIVTAPCPTITFGTATAINGTVGTAYSLNAGATTTSGTLAYSVTPALPAGLSISATSGLISGIPTTATPSATYTVRAQTSATCFATNPHTFAINAATCPTITFFSSGIAASGTVGTPYSLSAGATTTSGTLTYSVTPTLPLGLSINTINGFISGTPTTQTPSATYTVRAQTSATCFATSSYIFAINAVACPTITFGTATATNGAVGTAYSLNAGATTTSGTLAYSATPALPAGLSINATTGLISGTPTAVTTSATYTVRAQTSATCFATSSYTFGIGTATCPTITISPTTTLPNPIVGTPYSQAITQTGLTGTVTWSIQSGSLPAGLSFNATTATISGTPTTAVTSLLVQIQATNGTCTGVKPYNITVDAPIVCPTTITVAPNTIPNGTEGTAYNQTLTQTGLTGTVSWSRISGTLPTGLSISNAGIISGTPTTTGTFNFTVRVNQVNCFADKAYTIIVAANPTTSIANALGNEISVFPNPSKSNFLVNFEKAKQGAYEIILFDIYGRELYKQKINNISNILEINAISYPVGIYLLHILHNKEKVSLKLVKE